MRYDTILYTFTQTTAESYSFSTKYSLKSMKFSSYSSVFPKYDLIAYICAMRACPIYDIPSSMCHYSIFYRQNNISTMDHKAGLYMSLVVMNLSAKPWRVGMPACYVVNFSKLINHTKFCSTANRDVSSTYMGTSWRYMCLLCMYICSDGNYIISLSLSIGYK